MRNYSINFNRVANLLTPHYMGGRSFILFIQSLLAPLQSISDRWGVWAREKHIEAEMTSRVIIFENYLNKKYRKYFKDQTRRISFSESRIEGVPLYHQAAKRPINEMTLYFQKDKAKSNPALNFEYTKTHAGKVSFEVNCPVCDTSKISQEDFLSMLSFDINRYKIACTTYKINYI